MSAQEKQDRENLVNSILTGTVAALGGDAATHALQMAVTRKNQQAFSLFTLTKVGN